MGSISQMALVPELTEQHVLVLCALDEIEESSGPPTTHEVARFIKGIMLDYFAVKTHEIGPTAEAVRDLIDMGLVQATSDASTAPRLSITASGHEALEEYEA